MNDQRPLPDWLSFCLAYLAGQGVAWVALIAPRWLIFAAMTFEARLALPTAVKLAFIIYGLLVPMAGIVVFGTIFRRRTRRWQARAFWLIVSAAVYAMLGMIVLVVLRGLISTAEARFLIFVLPLVAGLLALRLTRA